MDLRLNYITGFWWGRVQLGSPFGPPVCQPMIARTVVRPHLLMRAARPVEAAKQRAAGTGYLQKGLPELKMDEGTLLTAGIIIISTPPCAIVLRIASINLSWKFAH